MAKVRIGIIGAGKIAERLHLPGYKEVAEAEVVAICDLKKNKADRLAEMFKIPAVYTDYKKMIQEAGIDAVSVCTPNYLHAEMTIFAANNKKQVLVEKPMSISLAAMKAMIASAKKNNVLLMVEQSQRFDAAHQALKEILESGVLGQFVSVRGKIGHAGPENWSDDSPWFFDKKLSGGGVSVDVGIHILDLIRFITGRDVKNVAATMANLVKKQYDLEDSVEAVVNFTDGTMGVFSTSWCTNPYEQTVTVYGNKGRATVWHGGTEGGKRLSGYYVDLANPYGGNIEIKTTIPEKPKTGSPVQHFVDCCQGKTKCISDGTSGMKSMAVMLAAFKSAKSKKFENVGV
jgi:UDP-N-acetylglucosamine 3-dehydrogenase